jgi:hypothetical protein
MGSRIFVRRKHSLHKHVMQEEYAKIQVEKKMEKVQENLAEAWPIIRRTTPQLPESSAAGELVEQIELLQVAWSELAICTENLEAQLWESQQEAEKQPQKLQEKMERVVLEGNNARETLHKKTAECTKIFWEVSDWMGIISHATRL